MKGQVGKVGRSLLTLFALIVVPLLLTAVPAAAQTVTLVTPNGGEVWTAGSSQTISWTTTGDIGPTVTLRLFKAGVADRVIATVVATGANSGSYVWTIPPNDNVNEPNPVAPGADYTVEVASDTVPAAVDLSDAPFTISPAAARVVTYPSGGEIWEIGKPATITWQQGAVAGSTVDIFLVRGLQGTVVISENVLAINVPNNGSFQWVIPTTVFPDTRYQIMINGANGLFYSDNYFTIMEPAFTVLAPNGGENWVVGTTRTITWAAVGAAGANVSIELYKGGQLETVIAASTPNDGNFAWPIPAGQALGDNYVLRVTSLTDPTYSDDSDNAFAISASSSIITYPVGGEVWLTGTTYTINWQLDLVTSATVDLFLVRGQSDPSPGGESIIILGIPNTGSFSWNLPKSIPSDVNYRVKLRYKVLDEDKVTFSDNYFTITQPLFRLLSPNGGESLVAGVPHTIAWTTTASAGADVRIDLYKGGALESTLAASTPNTGSFSWTVPATQPLGSDYVVRIASISQPSLFDESDAPFAIGSSAGIITAPVGGEVWRGGEQQSITWQVGAVASDTVSIFLVKGQSDPSPGGETPIILNYPNNGSFPWVVPASILADTDYRVKLVGGPATAYSDNYFTILQSDLRVVSPNGGEKWLAGATHDITWTTTGIGPNVRIDLFKGGKLNNVIAAVTPDDGTFAWTIRNEQNPGDYTVRVTSLTNAQVAGESFESFAVQAEQPVDILLSDNTVTTFSPIGSLIGSLTTLDPNPGDSFTYSLDFCIGCDNQQFQIQGGTLRTGAVFMEKGVKDVVVTSTDQSGLAVSRSFKIYLVGPNEPPTDIILDRLTISAGLPAWTRVGEFDAADPNLADPNFGETLLYTLVDTLTYPDNAMFAIRGNQLQTAVIFLNTVTEQRHIKVRVTDKGGLSRDELFTITIGVNQPPVLAAIGNKAVNEGQLLTFAISATDANGDPLLYSASNLPTGATFVGQTFRWTPTFTQAGAYIVHFEVTDGQAVDAEDITITVTDINPTLFFDDFTDGTAAGDASWNKNAGLWTVTAGKRYRASSTTVTSLSTVKGTLLPRISAGRVEGLVRMVNLAPSQNVMLVFAFQGAANYRYVQLVPGTGFLPGEVRLGQVGTFGGKGTGIVARTAVTAAVATNYALSVDLYPNGNARVYFKGALVLTYKFPTAVAGNVGVGVVRNGAEFDNFRVSDPTVLPAARTAK